MAVKKVKKVAKKDASKKVTKMPRKIADKEKAMFKKEGAMLEKLIKDAGYSKYKFALITQFSDSRLYQLCAGNCDIMTMSAFNLLAMARALKFETIDAFLEALGIDTLKDLLIK